MIERLRRNRLGQKLGDTGVARGHHAALVAVTGEQDDRNIGVAATVRLPDHLGQLDAIEDRHRPVANHDIRDIVDEHFERGGAVLGLVDFARAERMQQRAQNPAHVRVVVADQKPQFVEIDAKHRSAAGQCFKRLQPEGFGHIPSVNYAAGALTKGFCDGN